MTRQPNTSAAAETEIDLSISVTDEQLMLAYQAGNISAFEQLYKNTGNEKYFNYIKGYADTCIDSTGSGGGAGATVVATLEGINNNTGYYFTGNIQ